jgi:hypothetical protein
MFDVEVERLKRLASNPSTISMFLNYAPFLVSEWIMLFSSKLKLQREEIC